MTTREFKVAQALTSHPVKGMLTGPVTILNWSFPRMDVTRKDQVCQEEGLRGGGGGSDDDRYEVEAASL